MIDLKKHQFLFEELVKRDFKKKYKRTVLGMGWSVLSPLLMLLVMKLVFGGLFAKDIPHYTTYLFCGLLMFQFFSESSALGMRSLMENAAIFSKINVPKYLFLLAKNVQVLINFALILAVFFVFALIDGIEFSWRLLLLPYPIVTLLAFNIGIGFILSALFIFFKDIDYLWSVALQLMMYGSAIFYRVDALSPSLQTLFAYNPIYRHIAYVRELVITGSIPSPSAHLILALIAATTFALGALVYKRTNTKFLYYV